jgi:hypothetical protein
MAANAKHGHRRRQRESESDPFELAGRTRTIDLLARRRYGRRE